MSKVPKNIEDIYPLSPMQEGMLFHKILDDKSEEYFEQLSCNLVGEFDLNLFQKAWQKVIDRNPILRTSFVYKKSKKMVQVVHKNVQLNIDFEDLSSLDFEAQNKQIKSFLVNDRKTGIDLSKVPVIKLRVIKLNSQNHKFIWNHHHIILDGWSLPLVLKEVFFYYENYKKNIKDELPQSAPYKQYISWLAKKDIDEAKKYWSNYLKGFSDPTPLVIDKYKVDDKDSDILKKTIKIDQETSRLVNDFIKDNQITLSSFLQSIWAIILNKYSGERDIVFGQTVSGRPAELMGSEFIIGLFINTLPIRAKIDCHIGVSKWIKDFSNSLIEMRDYEYTPLYQIQKWSDLPSKENLFNSIFVFENYPIDESVKSNDISLKIENIDSFERTNYPITIISGPGNEIPVEIAFDKSQINEKLIDNLLFHFKYIIRQIVLNPNQKIPQLKLTNDVQLTDNSHPIIKDFIEEFEKVTEQHKSDIAINSNDYHITYDELDKRSNAIANYLISKGFGLEDKIGIFLDRSPEMIYAIIGTLKAGCAYVPIEINYPEDRINYIINDSDLKCILTTSKDSVNLNFGNKINLDQIELNNHAMLNVNVDPDNLAYLIYTSGSTGKPKGTLLTRKGLSNYLTWCLSAYPINEGKGSILHSPLSFDATITSIFTPLISGKAIYIVDANGELDELKNVLVREKDFSVLKITPAHLELLTTQLNENQLEGLTHALVIGGENLTYSQINRWLEHAPNTKIFNEYGPTETVVGSVVYKIESVKDECSVPIGQAIYNTNVYILDHNLNHVPEGVTGELYISSIDEARGYINRPSLTAEKFIPDPFTKNPGKRMYKTGDIVIRHLDGTLEFVGRKDNQVKIRGYRIELGEIENTINEIDGITKCVVLDKINERNEKELVVFFQSNSNKDIVIEDIRNYLKGKLPEYMIPKVYVKIDNFPLTNNGKIDLRKLREQKIEREVEDNIESKTTNETEQLILQIVKDLLKTNSVSLNDDFFELGGHSLTAAQCVARIRDIFNIDLPLKKIFESSSIKEIAKSIDEIKNSAQGFLLSKPKKYSREEKIPLSFSQSRLWFLDKLEPLKNNYNIPTAVLLEGELNLYSLEKSIQFIIQKHEILRSSYEDIQGKPFVVINNFDFKLSVEDLNLNGQSDNDEVIKSKVKKYFNHVFELNKAPLFKIKLLKISNQKHVLVLVMHHIISDGWSASIIINDLRNYYNALTRGDNINLEQGYLQYSDYAYWQKENYSEELVLSKIDFWKNYLEDIPECIDLPLDFKRPEVQTFNGKTLTFNLDAKLSEKLNKFNVKEGYTNFMTLLAVYQILLSKYSNQKDIVIGTPVANRQFSEFEDIVGFFANTIAIRTKLQDTNSVFQHIKEIRKNVIETFAHSDLPFEKIVEAMDISRNLSISPIFQVAFVYQNNSGKSIELNNLKISEYDVLPDVSKYDLTLSVAELNGQIRYSFEYNTDLFREETILQIKSHFEGLLNLVVNYPKKKIGFIQLPNENEKEEQINKLTNIRTIENEGKCIHDVFETVAKKYPEHTALTYSEFDENNNLLTTEINYSLLNKSANQLGRYLLSRNMNCEDIVAISLPRSIDLISSIFGVLKSGAAFLPVDPLYPKDRIDYMLENSGSKIVITNSFYADQFKEFKGTLIIIDALEEELSKFDDNNLSKEVNDDCLAYIIYTSGTTGKPKGTLLNHKGAVNLAQAQKEEFNITSDSKIFQFSSLSFDAFVWETVMALLNGASLNLVNQEIITNTVLLQNVLKALSITTITLPPSVLSVLNYSTSKELEKLSTVIVAGEHCPIELAKHWNGSRQFVNAYGPTESTVCASMYNYSNGPTIPIGKPINNFSLYILDDNMNIVPKGVIGELHITGIGLARGYLGKPDLTADKFVPNPFSIKRGARMYRSGDLVKLNDNYEIEFIGRKDNQIKLRGFRIELGEIESVLLKYKTIEEAIVMAREDKPGLKQLTAYLILSGDTKLNTNDIKMHLGKYLPAYMVPTNYVEIDSIPLTPSNKIDYSKLPIPDEISDITTKEYVAPETETEKILADIGKELLGIEKMGIYDNFFELGGHSLLATQFVSRVKEKLNKDLSLKELFENPSINELAKILESNSNDIEEIKITSDTRGDDDILSLLDEIENLSDDEAKLFLENDND